MNKITKNDPQAQTQDIVNENISKLKELFPEVFTEGKIDFETLESLLGEYVEKDDERYNFTWKGKAEARRIAQTPSTATLRPAKEESKNWDKTENLYIEGDNLEVLKLLQKSYHKKVKMIYIDPPYNTGKDFVYKDNYKDNLKNYMELTGQVDEEGNKISTNSDSSGRYHSNWLNMMYPRLKLARNLLKDDGVIFISIDDNELHNMRKICDEVFGEENFFGMITWINRTKPKNMGGAKYTLQSNMEYIFVYGKISMDKFSFNLPVTSEISYPLNDQKGNYRLKEVQQRKNIGSMRRDSMVYELLGVSPKNGYRWQLSKEMRDKLILEERIINESGRVYEKGYKTEEEGYTFEPFWTFRQGVSTAENAKEELEILMGVDDIFDTVKPIDLLTNILSFFEKESVVFDFFSGSATTAHAVMQLNAEDGGNRKFIMVQLPEPTDEKSEAYKAGYKNICEIGKERIRRAGDKIVKELKEKQSTNQEKILGGDASTSSAPVNPEDLDIGFKVFKLDSSNIKTWDATAENIEQKLLDSVHNIKSERSEEDVLFEVLLKYGLDLTLPIEEVEIDGKKIYSVGYGSLVVCLDDEIDMVVAKRIVQIKDEKKPETMNVIFKDTGFKDDVAKTNVVQYLEKYEVSSIRSI
jgi:adenine-specific DNA-methyltransferase